ncbi:hypothetical protein PM082_002728 [Marasmius tenuissimus]|nr:hypothetical protein PM082_002728 [Marasmius tenuissimus]
MSSHRDHPTWRNSAPSSPFLFRVFRWFINAMRTLFHITLSRFTRRRGSLFVCFGLAFVILLTTHLTQPGNLAASLNKLTPAILSHKQTLVFEKEDLQRIWYWEIASGHYPSRKPIPEEIGLSKLVDNPGLPPRKHSGKTEKPSSNGAITITNGVGSKRVYLDIKRKGPYPPRPIPGSIMDLDIVFQHCDFYSDKYVRDCLEVLRDGAGLNPGELRRVSMDDWKHVYLEAEPIHTRSNTDEHDISDAVETSGNASAPHDSRSPVKEVPPVSLPSPMPYRTYSQLESPCDPDYPRIFHMFWTGPFTDKPYMAILSFLYTQNTGLHVDVYPKDKAACRPQLWLWINPGSASKMHSADAAEAMMKSIKDSPWVAPFLDPRFENVIKFKVWDTAEQLDSIPEIKDEWRALTSVFESNGKEVHEKAEGTNDDPASADSYDKLSVVLSDLVRFILCQRYGGIYLDMDMLFLRDWEELWGWKGAFAYSWSGMSRYNTAVLHMNKNSALGTFLLRTALKHELDVHPISITWYLKDAMSTGLLYSVPDALFDSAWLNTDGFQRNRPPQPFLTDFQHFFETPESESAGPLALGFDGFFKGAFAYHYHNFWWIPFDATRNWPDLGPHFAENERKARNMAEEFVDLRDLDWSAALKRTFESYIRGERPNMYGEWIKW